MEEDSPALRERRHNQLLHLIEKYRLTDEQEDYLDTVKKNTEIEIASRFTKSRHNRNYKFPLQETQQHSEEEQFPRGTSFDHTYYDLRAQNYLKQPKAKIQTNQSGVSRRVKSLGSEKIDQKVLREIKKELRERPQERGSQRDRLMLPNINKNKNTNSHRILSKTEEKTPRIEQSASQKTIKNRQFQKMRDILSKEKRQKKVGELMGGKLLTEGGDLISFGHAKVLINKLRVISPSKAQVQGKQLRHKKLITE